jgi:transposase-like protein
VLQSTNTETMAAACTKCGSSNLCRNGKTSGGKQKYACKECGAYGSLNPTDRAYSADERAAILAAYRGQASLRSIERVFGVARQTVARWVKKHQRLDAAQAARPAADQG